MEHNDEYITLKECSKMLKIPESSMRKLKGVIPYTKVGKHLRFLKSDIFKYLLEKRVTPSKKLHVCYESVDGLTLTYSVTDTYRFPPKLERVFTRTISTPLGDKVQKYIRTYEQTGLVEEKYNGSFYVYKEVLPEIVSA